MANISSADSFTPLQRLTSRTTAFQGIDSQLIRCDIVFGMPSQDCRGTGICKLTSDLDTPPQLKNDCSNTTAFAGRVGEGNRVMLAFFRELLCAQLYSRHFRKGVLELTEPCPLPEGLVNNLKLKGKALLPGKYMVQEQDGCFRVEVACYR
ncbi:MAG: hypothetical protein DYG98_12805 [Haliscomenobacteraceae bacterium CHB4]|nr:hypothetical protein [Saprospiraceae bacterium]MCE7923930.1 hypothetical protein [Haliscomenobacteraceae bacterium CHB4]